LPCLSSGTAETGCSPALRSHPCPPQPPLPPFQSDHPTPLPLSVCHTEPGVKEVQRLRAPHAGHPVLGLAPSPYLSFLSTWQNDRHSIQSQPPLEHRAQEQVGGRCFMGVSD
jgi:hypothetical protein